MNKIGISLIAGSIGMAVGSVCSYIFFKKKYEKMYYERLQEAIDNECEYIRKMNSTSLRKENVEERQDEKPPELNPYNRLLNRLQSDLDGANEEMEDEPIGSGPPEFIDEDEFRFLPPHYEIRELQYFKGNGAVLDFDDEVVEEPEIYIYGLEDKLKEIPDQSYVYILIERMKIAVELFVSDASYVDPSIE